MFDKRPCKNALFATVGHNIFGSQYNGHSPVSVRLPTFRATWAEMVWLRNHLQFGLVQALSAGFFQRPLAEQLDLERSIYLDVYVFYP